MQQQVPVQQQAQALELQQAGLQGAHWKRAQPRHLGAQQLQLVLLKVDWLRQLQLEAQQLHFPADWQEFLQAVAQAVAPAASQSLQQLPYLTLRRGKIRYRGPPEFRSDPGGIPVLGAHSR